MNLSNKRFVVSQQNEIKKTSTSKDILNQNG